MKKIFIFLFLSLAFMSYSQKVTNARFEQVGKQVEITYTLDKQSDIQVYLSTDGGNTYRTSPLRAVSGDVGQNVSAGNKRVLWSPLEEMERCVFDDVVFKIVPAGSKQTFTVNGVSFTMIKVEGGTFTMGCTSEQGNDCYDDEKPSHSVTLSDYYIGQTEVTQGLWKAIMGSNPSYFKKGDNYPVENVNWNDCQDFIRKLNQLTGKNFSLPTESQWEYAARGGKKSQHYKYAGSNTIGNVAWYDNNSSSSTHPVATKSPNELGLYDMSGNVWEWCKDWLGSYSSSSQTNPHGASSGSSRVLRGGSWDIDARSVSDRDGTTPSDRFRGIGLRLCLVP